MWHVSVDIEPQFKIRSSFCLKHWIQNPSVNITCSSAVSLSTSSLRGNQQRFFLAILYLMIIVWHMICVFLLKGHYQKCQSLYDYERMGGGIIKRITFLRELWFMHWIAEYKYFSLRNLISFCISPWEITNVIFSFLYKKLKQTYTIFCWKKRLFIATYY